MKETTQLERDQGRPLNHIMKDSSGFGELTVHETQSSGFVLAVKCAYSLTTLFCANCKADLFIVRAQCNCR